ncbi:hypothetical protein BCD67_15130 [Oscillatoriales cyanobacterium USR001]|nr:hypothetical protein BCD67_15130 [Oscillatoriales cyanobacterium USR001]
MNFGLPILITTYNTEIILYSSDRKNFYYDLAVNCQSFNCGGDRWQRFLGFNFGTQNQKWYNFLRFLVEFALPLIGANGC